MLEDLFQVDEVPWVLSGEPVVDDEFEDVDDSFVSVFDEDVDETDDSVADARAGFVFDVGDVFVLGGEVLLLVAFGDEEEGGEGGEQGVHGESHYLF